MNIICGPPQPFSVTELAAGEVGVFICGIKSIRDVTVGDTITLAKNGATEPLEGFQKTKPMVFAGIFPVESPDFKELEVALEKLALNDSSLSIHCRTKADITN